MGQDADHHCQCLEAKLEALREVYDRMKSDKLGNSPGSIIRGYRHELEAELCRVKRESPPNPRVWIWIRDPRYFVAHAYLVPGGATFRDLSINIPSVRFVRVSDGQSFCETALIKDATVSVTNGNVFDVDEGDR